MRKNFLTKVMTLVLTATMALTPVTASAAEKTIITAKDVDSYFIDNYDEETEVTNYKALYDSIAAMNGCYQENGYKIYTALNGKTVTVKKTGNYSVIVGGKSARKDEGTFKFVAPKTGTYKFTFTTKDNVAGDSMYIQPMLNGAKYVIFNVNYKDDVLGKVTKSSDVFVTNSSKRSAYIPSGLSRLADMSGNTESHMTKVSGSIKLKKGQYVGFIGRSCGAAYDEIDQTAYNFVGYDLKITKTK